MADSHPIFGHFYDDEATAAAALEAAIAAFNAPTTSAEGLKRHNELLEAWRSARAYFAPRDIGSSLNPPRPVEDPKQIAAISFLDENGRREDMVNEAMDMMQDSFGLVRRDVARYMGRLQETSTLSRAPQTMEVMVEFMEKLNMWLRRWAVPMKIFGDNKVLSGYTSQFLQLLHSSLPAIFLEYLHTFFTMSLASLPAHLSDPPHTEELLASMPPVMTTEDIRPPSPHLSRLGILPRYSAVLTAVAHEEIERVVKEEAAKGWDVRRLPRVRQRVAVGLVNWIASCFEKTPTTSQFLRTVFSRFDYYLCKCLFDIRTDELFDIIVDYPDSLAALEDLRECLAKIDQRDTLVTKLKASNLKRLLHPGAETNDVLTQYISTIRCLRILDPPGVLLHKVALPIRAHLRNRPDTTKCIVAALVEGDDLSDENDGEGGLIKDNQDDEVEDYSDPKWEPEPIDAAPEFRSGKAGDIVSTLVSIFETREVIIKELQALLALRLLQVKDYDSVKEIRIIEMLKLRFGEPALQICDVMLKDMADSKRIDDRIHADTRTKLHPLIISHRFWPPVPSTTFILPPKLSKAQQAYEDAFHHFKPDKHLLFYQQLGTVTLKLELADRTLQVEATALQAAVIETMEAGVEWQVSDLADKLQAEEEDVHAALAFWAEEGVVQEGDNGAWNVLEHAPPEE